MAATKTTETDLPVVTKVPKEKSITPGQDIDTLDQLANYLWIAAKVELSTIPLYLYSAYSIKTKGYSQWAPQRGVLRTLIGVAIEEMLHLCLVRNLMLAINKGDHIKFYSKDFIPEYPGTMLNRYPKLCLDLEKLSKDHLDTFITLEAPADMLKGLPDDSDHSDGIALAINTLQEFDDQQKYPLEVYVHPDDSSQYRSLGEFYRFLKKCIEDLSKNIPDMWREPNLDKQYLRGYWNEFGTGKPLLICDLDTAKKALNIVIEQGEGSSVSGHASAPPDPNHPTRGDDVHTHFQKFIRLREGIEGFGVVDGSAKKDIPIERAVWPVKKNPKVEECEDPRIKSLMKLFNAAYCYMLCILDKIYETSANGIDPCEGKQAGTTGETDRCSKRYGLERNGIAAMQGILYPIAEILVRTPISEDNPSKGHAGPSFEYYDFEKKDKKKVLEELCEAAIKYFPELGGNDGVERQIHLLVEV